MCFYKSYFECDFIFGGKFCFLNENNEGNFSVGKNENGFDIAEKLNEFDESLPDGSLKDFIKFMIVLSSFLKGKNIDMSGDKENGVEKMDSFRGQIINVLNLSKRFLTENKYKKYIVSLKGFELITRRRDLTKAEAFTVKGLMSKLLAFVNAKQKMERLKRNVKSNDSSEENSGGSLEVSGRIDSGSLEGYRRVRGRVPYSVARMARQALKSWHSGVVTEYVYDGVVYALVGEIHQHKQTDNVPDSLKRPHHGISVFVKEERA